MAYAQAVKFVTLDVNDARQTANANTANMCATCRQQDTMSHLHIKSK